MRYPITVTITDAKGETMTKVYATSFDFAADIADAIGVALIDSDMDAEIPSKG